MRGEKSSAPAEHLAWQIQALDIRDLPEEGDEAGAGAEAVVGVAGEVAAEQFFLVEVAKDEERDDEKETRERPPRAQRERREDEHENRAEVHGLPGEAIEPSRDHSVSFFDLHGAGWKEVFSQELKGDQRAVEDKDKGKK